MPESCRQVKNADASAASLVGGLSFEHSRDDSNVGQLKAKSCLCSKLRTRSVFEVGWRHLSEKVARKEIGFEG